MSFWMVLFFLRKPNYILQVDDPFCHKGITEFYLYPKTFPMDKLDQPIKTLIDKLPQTGTLEKIVLRGERKSMPEIVEKVKVSIDGGLAGDHFSSTANRKRQVTLIQQEHLEGVASIIGIESIDPKLTRRNLVVRGINLLSLKDRQFQIGEVILEGTGYCHPCSRMEENLGEGGYNAMRGHGGITAKVISGGNISVCDQVKLV